MATVWKFKIDPDEINDIQMPRGAKVLSVQVQRGQPNIWALVEPTSPLEKRSFFVCGTGYNIHNPESLTYVGTFQLDGGSLVFHLFEVKS